MPDYNVVYKRNQVTLVLEGTAGEADHVIVRCRNETGSSIAKGMPVAVVGFSVPSNRPLVAPADNTDPSLRPAIGITQDIVPDDSNFEAMVVGRLSGVNTSAYSLTDQLVLGSPGLSRPPPDEDPFPGEVQLLAVVSRVHATQGIIDVNLQGLSPVNGPAVFYGIEVTQTGLSSGGEVTRGGGLDIDVAAGVGFIADAGVLTRVVWSADTVTVPASGTFGIRIDVDGNVVVAGAGYPTDQIVLAFGVSDATDVLVLTDHALSLSQHILQFHNHARDTIGPINVSGQVATINGGTGLDVAVTSGVFYIDTHRLSSTAGTPITFRYWYDDGAGDYTTVAAQTTFDPDFYDDGSGTLAAVPAGEYVRHLLLSTVSDDGTEFHGFYGVATYATQAEAEAAANPAVTTFINSNCVRIAAIITQEGNPDIVSIIDQRPRLGQFAAQSQTGSHASLSDLLWDASGHTGTAGLAAAFDSLGVADYRYAAAELEWGNGSVAATTTDRYLSPSWDPGTAPLLASDIEIDIVGPGVLFWPRVRHNTPAGNGNAIVYTVQVDGVDTALTLSLASTGTDDDDLVTEVAVAAGKHTVRIEVTKAASVVASPGDVKFLVGWRT